MVPTTLPGNETHLILVHPKIVRRFGPTTAIVYGILESFGNDEEDEDRPGLSDVALMAGISRQTVRRAIRALESAGVFTVEPVPGHASKYRFEEMDQ